MRNASNVLHLAAHERILTSPDEQAILSHNFIHMPYQLDAKGAVFENVQKYRTKKKCVSDIILGAIHTTKRAFSRT